MRILLASNASYSPPKGGSTRSNLAWLAELAKAGHPCEVLCPTNSQKNPEEDGMDQNGIRISCFREFSHRTHLLGERIRDSSPDWVLISSEDLTHVLLQEAQRHAPGRLVYLAHTPQFFPFGPESWNRDTAATRTLESAAAIIAIGTHMAGYIAQHLGRKADVVHPSIYGKGPFPDFGSFDEGSILMINPSVVKGIRIFLGLADHFPEQQFTALSGWATTSNDLKELAKRPNIHVRQPVRSIDEVLATTRLLLMPSLWYEGFGLIVMEAMLRGLPVVASNSGGLVEAKMGTDYVIPIVPVELYQRSFDETHMPVAVEPRQNLRPWIDALSKLLTSREAYASEARQSKTAALQFVQGLPASSFEYCLQALPIRSDALTEVPRTNLTDVKRQLLLQTLRDRKR